MTHPSDSDPPATAPRRFGAGIDDAIILPLVLIGLAAKKLFHAALSVVIHVLDYAFPILLQVARFPLFTVRIIGDAVAALLKGVVRFLPMPGPRRDAWRAWVTRHWSWLKQKISYKAFEAAVHHAFEGGMAWVFRRCRTLSPGGALLVLAGAVVWFPASFAGATALHAYLFAEAATLPAWMQLLHPVATLLAKTKLLVLPAYPAAWPQAKKHGAVQATFRCCLYVAALHPVRKTGYRYRQTERAAADAGTVLGRTADRVGLSHLAARLLAGFNGLAAWTGKAVRATTERIVRGASALPLLGPVVRRYATHYDDAERQETGRLSQRVGGFFERWSIKFTPAYYEAKDRHAAAAGAGVAAEGAVPPRAVDRPRTDT